MDRGVLYIVFGDNFIKEMKYSAESVKKYNPDLHITAFADKPVECEFIDEVKIKISYEMIELDITNEIGDRDFSAGLVDVKSFWIEPTEIVAQRVRDLIRHIDPSKLTLTPDCGFFPVPRWLALKKLATLVKGAGIVRSELLG